MAESIKHLNAILQTGQNHTENDNRDMIQSETNTSISGARGKDRGLFRILARLASWFENEKSRKSMDTTTRAALGRRVLFLVLSQNQTAEKGVERSLKMGMDPRGTDESGLPIALQALVMNTRECNDWAGTQALLMKAQAIDMEDPSGGTALSLAAQQGHHKLPLIEWLLEMGANPNHVDRNGRTPLFRSLDGRRPFLSFGDPSEDVRVLDILLRAAGEKSLGYRDRQGRTILDLARDRKDRGAEECIEGWQRFWASEKIRENLAAIAARPQELELAERRM